MSGSAETTRNSVKMIRIVPPNERMTSGSLTRYEVARAVSIRAQQIEQTAVEFVDNSGISDSNERAVRELLAGKSPLKLRRKVGTVNGEELYEEWSVRELSIPSEVRALYT